MGSKNLKEEFVSEVGRGESDPYLMLNVVHGLKRRKKMSAQTDESRPVTENEGNGRVTFNASGWTERLGLFCLSCSSTCFWNFRRPVFPLVVSPSGKMTDLGVLATPCKTIQSKGLQWFETQIEVSSSMSLDRWFSLITTPSTDPHIRSRYLGQKKFCHYSTSIARQDNNRCCRTRQMTVYWC